MSMSITWTYQFPRVTFRAARLMVGDPKEGRSTDGGWDPKVDFHVFLDRYAPTAEALTGPNERIVRRMDEARIAMRERVVFHELDGQEQWDHEASTDENEVYFNFRMWQIELRPWSWEEEKVQHGDGQDVDISAAGSNELYVHRVNAINFLWTWLLDVEPRGQYGNVWVVPQVGVTEYDNTMFALSAFGHDGIREHFLNETSLLEDGTVMDKTSLEDTLAP